MATLRPGRPTTRSSPSTPMNQFTSNLSGLFYEAATGTDPAVIWAVQNGPSLLHRLVFDGTTWVGTATDGWAAGKTMHYPTGMGGPDSEGVTKAEAGVVGDLRRHGARQHQQRRQPAERPPLRHQRARDRVDRDARLEPHRRSSRRWAPNLGLEAITWVPDTYLVASGFIDESTLAAYDPTRYPDHGTGLVLRRRRGERQHLRLRARPRRRAASSASRRCRAARPASWTSRSIATSASCGRTATTPARNKSTMLRVGGGHFQIQRFFDHPPGLTDSNNEGITFAPESRVRGRPQGVLLGRRQQHRHARAPPRHGQLRLLF